MAIFAGTVLNTRRRCCSTIAAHPCFFVAIARLAVNATHNRAATARMTPEARALAAKHPYFARQYRRVRVATTKVYRVLERAAAACEGHGCHAHGALRTYGASVRIMDAGLEICGQARLT